MAMDPELMPTLVRYYQQAQCTKDLAYKLDVGRHERRQKHLQRDLQVSGRETAALRTENEELKANLTQAQITLDVRQREVESMRARYQNTDKADKAIAETWKVQADSFKREIGELQDDLQSRIDELEDLRQDALERDKDLKAARDLTRSRDKEMKEMRDQVRARESELRKANHLIGKLQANLQSLEADVAEGRDALEAMRDALTEAEERYDTLHAQKQIVPTVAPAATAAAPTRAPSRATKPVAARSTKAPIEVKAQKKRHPSPALQDMDADESMESQPMPTPEPRSTRPIYASTPIFQQREEDLSTDYTIPPSLPPKPVAAKSKVKVTSVQPQAAMAATVKAKPEAIKRAPSAAAIKSTANKENHNAQGISKASKKSKTSAPTSLTDFVASPPPPLSSPPTAPTPKAKPRQQKSTAAFSMTPFIDRTKLTNGGEGVGGRQTALSMIPLSPPTPPTKHARLHADDEEDADRDAGQRVSVQQQQQPKKKKRKLLGGTKTLMDDDTPRRPGAATTKKALNINFGKELSPLKRPTTSSSSAALLLKAT